MSDEAAQAWLESVAMRPMLEAMLESICKDKPDNLLHYSIVWMRESYPEQAGEAANAGLQCDWAPRTDVDVTPEALMEYLKQIDATVILEGILENAIRVQPTNVVAYVIDECAALIGGADVGIADFHAAGLVHDLAASAARSTSHPDAGRLFEAISDGDVNTLHGLLQSGVPADSRDTKTNATPLIAAAEGELECVEVLLSMGADGNAQSKMGTTPLIAAVMYSDSEIIQKLLEYGADPQVRDIKGKSAIDYAVEMDQPEILQLVDPHAIAAVAVAEPPKKRPPPRRCSVSSESVDPSVSAASMHTACGRHIAHAFLLDIPKTHDDFSPKHTTHGLASQLKSGCLPSQPPPPQRKVDLSTIPRHEKSAEVMERIGASLEGQFLIKGLDAETRKVCGQASCVAHAS